MTDRELLEAAAKAAGLDAHAYCAPWAGMAQYNKHLDEFYGPTWSPLTDDGDALRLAVKLALEVCHTSESRDKPATVHVSHCLGSACGHSSEAHGADPYAATRRAIVRAAAAMAKEPKP